MLRPFTCEAPEQAGDSQLCVRSPSPAKLYFKTCITQDASKRHKIPTPRSIRRLRGEASKRWGSKITFLKSFWICVWRACIFLNIARFFASSFAESLVWRLIDWSDCEAACTASNALFTCPSPLRTDCGASAFYGCRKNGEERKIGRRCSGEEAQEAARLRREGRRYWKLEIDVD